MEKSYYFYFCDINSKVGKKLRSFHHRANRAAQRADDYARKYGAVSYIPPVQFFEGGVDYLEFDHEPDERVWRKRFNADDRAQYEPNCMSRPEILVVPDDRFQPSDTWNRTYSHEHLTWEQVSRRFPLSYWARTVKYQLTGDKEKDMAAVDARLSSCSFVPFIEFFGIDPALVPAASPADASPASPSDSVPAGSVSGEKATVPAGSPAGSSPAVSVPAGSASGKKTPFTKKSVPNYLRRAIQAEKDRLALPVIETEWLFALLDMADLPTDKDERKAFLANMETPLFFYYAGKDRYYIRCQRPCKAEGLHETTAPDFNHYKRFALKGEV